MKIDVGPGKEYRIEMPEGRAVRLMVLAGIGEVRGQELLNGKWYSFTNIKTSVFTFTGMQMELEDVPELGYIAHSSMYPYVFQHFQKLQDGTTTLVLGNGRSTVATTLLNYFVRLQKKAIFTELDPSSCNIFPGTISSLQNESLVDYRGCLSLNNPVCMFLGCTDIDNMELFEIQYRKLNELIEERFYKSSNKASTDNLENEDGVEQGPAKLNHSTEAEGNARHPHIIIAPNFANVSEQVRTEHLNNICKTFNVTTAMIVGDERLFHKLDLVCSKIFIENSGYIATNKINASISRYFNGADGEYTSSSVVLKTGWETIRIGEEYIAPESALPLGASRKVNRVGINRVDISEHAVLGISEAETEEEIVSSPVQGFVVYVDPKRSRVLCTQPRLPRKKFMIQGSLKYIDY